MAVASEPAVELSSPAGPTPEIPPADSNSPHVAAILEQLRSVQGCRNESLPSRTDCEVLSAEL